MHIDDLFPLLETRLEETRKYRVTSDGFFHEPSEKTKRRYRSVAPHIVKQLAIPRPRNGVVTYSDLAMRGPGRQLDLAGRWGIPLPADYCKFCELYAEYVLAGRLQIGIMDAEDIEEDTDGIRLGWSVADSATRRLFYFAEVLGDPAHFAFRWNEEFTKMDIVFSWDYGDIGEPVLLGPNSDRFVSDENFTSWLARMVKSDCFPLFPSSLLKNGQNAGRDRPRDLSQEICG